MKQLIDKLEQQQRLSGREYTQLLEGWTPEDAEYLFVKARKAQKEVFGNQVFMRGLIEVSSYCKNDCNYCGLRKSNQKAERYRLTPEEILACCAKGHELGFRTFVLQGGEDGYFTDERLVPLVAEIHKQFADCAITLSLGERSRESYQKLKLAGADRYLLRHETANAGHYAVLHPQPLTWAARKQCLLELKEIGFQVGCGFMVGSPGQTVENMVQDLLFIQEFSPHMVGIGPFIPHKDTPFANQTAGTPELTCFLLGLVRLMLPKVLLPATTALGTIQTGGRERGILCGANVVMPNLSPPDVRGKYLLYNNKVSDGDEAAERCRHLQQSLRNIGYEGVVARGDHPDKQPQTNTGQQERQG